VDLSSVMAELPLPQRVGKNIGEGGFVFLLGCMWHWMNGWGENSQLQFWWGRRHQALGLTSPGRPRVKSGSRPRLQTYGAEARPACMAADSDEWVWRPAQDALALGPTSGPTALGSCVGIHFAWVLCRTQFYWVLY